MSNGFSKVAWPDRRWTRGRYGRWQKAVTRYFVTPRDGASWGPTFTWIEHPDRRLHFVYFSIGWRNHWLRWHWLSK